MKVLTRARPAVLAAVTLAVLAPAVAQAAPAPWQIVPTPDATAPSSVAGLAVLGPKDAWAVGEQSTGELAMHWDGTTWKAAPTHAVTAGGFSAVAARTGDDVWAVGQQGYYNNLVARAESRVNLAPGPGVTTLIEHWDGRVWTVVPGPNPGTRGNVLYGVATAGREDVWAVGSSQDVDSDPVPLVQHWDGHAWTRVSTPASTPGELQSVTVIAPDDVWAVGSDGPRSGTLSPLALHWNGRAWSKLAVPSRVSGNTDAKAVVGGPSGPLLVGTARTGNTRYGIEPAFARWQHGAWAQAPAPPVDQQQGLYVIAMAADRTGAVWAGGHLTTDRAPYVARYDGKSWQPIALPATGLSFVNALATTPDGRNTWAAVYSGTGAHRHPVLLRHLA
ncbi:hypothetical protein [Kutzneria albida]|uniref:Secreted protein n=1 Tax=Kutzneria albida DSM 43870 TaxID=1449976 RepID=W5WG84_9PSEU|nr:hypothetical protein [Kutzneria albida]AHI00194.1 hypothetical protein KALB_6835 [Kutzneria albida DSM 43870]